MCQTFPRSGMDALHRFWPDHFNPATLAVPDSIAGSGLDH